MDEGKYREILVEFFDERARVDAETHGEHHAWIREQIESQARKNACEIEAKQARTAMLWKIASNVLQYSVLGIAGALWYFFRHGSWPN